MGYEASTAGITREEVDKGYGAKADKPGRYRSKITKVMDHTDDETPRILLVMNVTGTTARQSPVGSTLFHSIYFTDKSIPMAIKFYLRTGLLVEDENGRLLNSDGEESIRTDDALNLEGVEVCGEWSEEVNVDDRGVERRSLRCNYGEFWLASDKAVSGWDCNGDSAASGSGEPDDGLGDV